MMREYGRTVASIAHHFLGVVRYGAEPRTRNAVLLESIANGFQPNLCTTRAEAVSALERLRARR
jgi:hypothetical protein